jgi:hypothetical protein
MMQDHPRNSVLESWYVRALDKFLSGFSEAFTLQLDPAAPTTTVRVPAGVTRSDGASASIGINGLWRFRDTAVSRAHPGGASGTYLVYAVAKNNAIVNTPLPYTDNTDYTFDLRIVASPGPPAIVPGTVDVYRRIGRVEWDGTKITGLTQEVGEVGVGNVTASVWSTTVGNGVATSFTLAHSLGTRDVVVVVRDSTTGELEQAQVIVNDGNVITVTVDSPPPTGGLTVTVLGGAGTPPATPITAYAATAGDGAATAFTVTHNLNTRTVSPYDEPDVIVEHTDANTVTLRTEGYVPAAGELGVTVMSRGGVQGVASQHASQHLPGTGSDPVQLPLITSVAAFFAITPTDKQEIYFLADATNGVIWHLRYRAFLADGVTPNPSPYKWEYVGGGPLTSEIVTSQTRTASTAYTDLATVGPSILLPLAGDYMFEMAAQLITPNTAQTVAFAALAINGVVPTAGLNADAMAYENPAAAFSYATGSREMKRTITAAGNIAKLMYANEGSVTGSYSNRTLRATPVRVG